MRLGFVIWGLYSTKGGLERFGANLLRTMRERGHECVAFYRDAHKTGRLLYPLPADVPAIDLALYDEASILRAKSLLRAHNLDALCAMFSWDSLLWFPALCNNTGIPLLISEHSVPHVIEGERWNRYERLGCLAGADAIHLLNEAFLPSLPDFLRERATVIPNPAEPPAAVDWRRENAPRKRLLAVGRLEDGVKQFSLLIQAFALLASTFPEWDLRICGDGRDGETYGSLAAALELTARVSLAGAVDGMDREYAAAHLFCIPSRYEGFPLALLEAQGFALPAVGFAACAGVNEIIVHGENGLLAPDMNAQNLAASLGILMKNAVLRRRMGERGQALLARYEPQAIYDRWEALLARTAAAKNNTRLTVPPLSERERAELALREIVNRPHPFARPASEGFQHVIRRQELLLRELSDARHE
jgi:glycosyltransferase involved in cell wall biosynthesis